MKKVKLLPFITIILLFISGCGESIYDGAADKSTSAAVTDQLDFDLIRGSCQSVINHYDNQVSSNIILNDDDLYKYVSALLSCSGFNIVNGIDSILIDGGSDIYKTAGALMGITVIDMNKSASLQSSYDKAIKVCFDRRTELEKNNLKLTETNTTLCGLAGMMGSIVNVTAMMLNTSGGGANTLELSQTGFENFAQNEMDGTLAAQGLASYLKEKNDFIMYLDNGLILGEDGATAIGTLMGQNDFSNVLKDLSTKLRDSSGAITETSLLEYLKTSLGLQIP